MLAALLGLISVAASGAILLHLVPTGLDPIRYAVSDYRWTAYHLGYRAMVVLQGVGADPHRDRTLTWTGRIHMLLAGTGFASIAVAASHTRLVRGSPTSSARSAGSSRRRPSRRGPRSWSSRSGVSRSG